MNPSGGTGLYTASSAGGSYADLRISGGSYGVQAYGTSSHSVRDSRITAFTVQGVKIGVAGDIDLGTSGDHGENDIYSSEGSVTKYISAKNHLGSLGPVPAIQNWWGADPPPSSMFTPSQVSYTPWNSSAYHYASLEGRIGVVQLPVIPVPALGFSPNPFRGGGEIHLAIPGGTAFSIELYSLSGRLVRNVEAGYATWDHETRIAWDGMDNGGRRVAAGVYFLRLAAGSEVLVRKIVRLP